MKLKNISHDDLLDYIFHLSNEERIEFANSYNWSSETNLLDDIPFTLLFSVGIKEANKILSKIKDIPVIDTIIVNEILEETEFNVGDLYDEIQHIDGDVVYLDDYVPLNFN